MRGEEGERQEKEGREALARVFRHNEDPEELLNPNLEDISYPREVAAAAAAIPVIDPIDEQLLAFSTSAPSAHYAPGSHLKYFQSQSLGGRKSRSFKKIRSFKKSRSFKRS